LYYIRNIKSYPVFIIKRIKGIITSADITICAIVIYTPSGRKGFRAPILYTPGTLLEALVEVWAPCEICKGRGAFFRICGAPAGI